MAQTDISIIIFVLVVSELTTWAVTVLETSVYTSVSQLKRLLVRESFTEFRRRETLDYVTYKMGLPTCNLVISPTP